MKKVLQLIGFVFLGAPSVSFGCRLHVGLKVFYGRLFNRSQSATTFGEHLVLADAILRIPKDTPGDIAEFGCFKGMSSISLSIAAHAVGRSLIIFDSFEGLPDPASEIHNLGTGEEVKYRRGEYASPLESVRAVIGRYGEIGCCRFVKGFYADTLSDRLAEERFAMVFEDADLIESVREVLAYAWPKLQPGSIFFSHEARDLEVTKLFFNDTYWQASFGQKAPGLIGVGLGLPIDARRNEICPYACIAHKCSGLAFAVKPALPD